MTGLYPRPLVAWYSVIVLTLIMMFSLMDRMVISILVVPIQGELNLSDVDMGWILGVAFGVFYSVMGIPLGRMADRLNRVRLIAAGIILWSLMTVLSGFAGSFWELFFARMGVGVGEAILAPAGWSLIADLFPPTLRARALSFFQLGAISGIGIGFLLGGAVFELSQSPEMFAGTYFSQMSSWRIVFLFAGLPGIILAGLVFSIKDPRTQVKSSPVPLIQVYQFLRGEGRVLLRLFVGMGGIILMIYSVNSWTPTLLTRKFGIDPGEVGYLLGIAVLIGGIPGVFLGGWLTDRAVSAGRDGIYVRLLMISAACILPVVVLISQVSHMTATIALIGLFNFFVMLPNGVLVAYIQRVTPREIRGVVSAFYALIVNLIGYLLGPAAVAQISDRFLGGEQYIGQSLAIVGIVVSIMSLLLFVSSRKKTIEMIPTT